MEGGLIYQSYPVTTVLPGERLEYFRALVDDVFSPTLVLPPVRSASGFSARMDVAQLGSLRLARIATSALTVRRRAVDAGQLADSPFLVKFQLRGESLWRQRGREVHLRPGDFVIASQAEPYELIFPGDYEMPVLAVGVETMRHLVPDPQRFLGQRMSGDDADCGLLSSFVAQVAARMDRLQEPFITRVEANLLDLLGGVLSARSGSAGLTPEQQRNRIRAYVERHLHDHALGPNSIASAFSMSTRSLHALFEGEPMSIGRHIKACRLESVRSQLADPALRRGRSLTDLALDAGFYDLSHMTRSFREQYGTTPRDYLAAQSH